MLLNSGFEAHHKIGRLDTSLGNVRGYELAHRALTQVNMEAEISNVRRYTYSAGAARVIVSDMLSWRSAVGE